MKYLGAVIFVIGAGCLTVIHCINSIEGNIVNVLLFFGVVFGIAIGELLMTGEKEKIK